MIEQLEHPLELGWGSEGTTTELVFQLEWNDRTSKQITNHNSDLVKQISKAFARKPKSGILLFPDPNLRFLVASARLRIGWGRAGVRLGMVVGGGSGPEMVVGARDSLACPHVLLLDVDEVELVM